MRNPYSRRLPWASLILFLVMSLGIVTAGWQYYEREKKQVQVNAETELAAIAELKIRQISAWRMERLSDADIVSHNAFNELRIRPFLLSPAGTESGADIRTWLESYLKNGDYQDVFLMDTNGNVRLAFGSLQGKTNEYTRPIVAAILRANQPILSDIHQTEDTGNVHLDMYCPLKDWPGSKTAKASCFGIVIFRINPRKFLYPLIQSWPGPSRTAETLLVRREGNFILFLNELRHRHNTAMKLRLPIDRSDLPAAIAVQGREGFFEGNDYRGKRVFAVARQVPGASWYMLAKVDKAELLAPLRVRAKTIMLLVSGLIFITGFVLLALWMHYSAVVYRRHLEAERERQRLALRFDILTRYANDSIMLLDRQQNLVEVNERACSTYGYTRAEMLGMHAVDFRPPELRADLAEEFQKANREDGSVYETMHLRKNGIIFPVEISLRALKIDNQTYYQAITRDITERKRNEAELRRAKEDWEQTFDAVPDLIALIDMSNRYVRVNKAMADKFDCKPQDLVGRLCHESMHGTLTPPENCPHAQLMKDGKAHSAEVYEDSLNGEFMVTCTPLYDAAGKLNGCVHVARDITESKQTQKALIAEHNLLHALMESIPDKVFFKDAASRFVRVSIAHAASLGLRSPEDAIGKTDFDFMPRDRAQQAYNEEQEVIRSHQSLIAKVEEIHESDGRVRWNSVAKAPIVGADGQVTGLVGISRDISHEIVLQHEIQQTRKIEAIGQLAGGIAHDFNNLIQSILGFGEMLLDSLDEKDPRWQDVNEIQKSAKRAAALTHQLLAFSRRQNIELKEVDLNATVLNMEKMLRRLIGEDIELVNRLDPHLKPVKADPGQIEQIIMNLAINARDAMPKGGRLSISTTNVTLQERDAVTMAEGRRGSFACLAVADTGAGMNAETRSHIFEPFFSTKPPGQGTGLGLAVIYGIVKQHNGWINVYSQVNQGSAFKLYLPINEPSQEDTALEDTSSLLEPQGHGERILMVEDEASVRNLTVRILRANGYEVFVACTAQEAVQLFENEGGRFDLLFSDVVLTDKTGIDLAAEILARSPSLPILLCSGYTDEKSRWSIIQERGYHFLQKPYPSATLLREIKALCAKRAKTETDSAGNPTGAKP